MKHETIDLPTPRWAIPLLSPARYKGAYGGRGGGKSHEFGGMAVEAMALDKDLSIVCVREVQKTLTLSVKKLIETKITDMNLEREFEVQQSIIKRRNGSGVMAFQGMQDHTADSIKSLEGFRIAWVEEAQSLSARSLRLLRPTIRTPGSELWFSWNPDSPEAPVEFLRNNPPPNSVVVECNWRDNPFLPGELIEEMRYDRSGDPEIYAHVWEGAFITRSDRQIFGGKYSIEEFEPNGWEGPFYGADWGFSRDPTVLVEAWIAPDGRVAIRRECSRVGLEIDNTPSFWKASIPGSENHVIRADNARPETISHMRRHGFPRILGADKWKGSVEDGVEWLRSKGLLIHPSCTRATREARLYRYKVNRLGDILAQIDDAENHIIDALRYALAPLIARKGYDMKAMI